MPNAQLDHFINALEGKVVPILIVVTIVAGLLSLFLKWLHHALFRRNERLAPPPNEGH